MIQISGRSWTKGNVNRRRHSLEWFYISPMSCIALDRQILPVISVCEII